MAWKLLDAQVVRRALVAAIGLTACFGPKLDFESGALTCDVHACPPGYECRSDMRCWLVGASAPKIDAPILAPPPPDGGSTAVCTGSERSCASPTQPQHCVDGAWVADPVCDASAPICDQGQCGAGCVAPAMRCLDDRTPQSCNPSGTWDTLAACMFVCTGAGQCTGECVPNDKQCRNGNELWACGADGMWKLSQTCPMICESASCGGDCTDNETRCNPTIPGVPQTCNGGHWQDQAPCTFACLPSGTCAPACDPAGPGTCIDGDAFTCDATGNFVFAMHCATNCSAGACTGVCHDGDKQCSGAGNRTPQTCTGGSWVDGTQCEFVCSAGSCQVTECHPNVDKKCTNGVPFSCDSTGHYVAGPACAFVCDGNQCGGICKPGTFRCNGSTNLEKCAPDGKSWMLDHACQFGCSSNQCNACTPDTMAVTCQDKCGTVVNNCGTPVSCGDTCAATHGQNWICSASTNTCQCSRDVAADCSNKCGTIVDRCGFSVDCTTNGGLACNGTGQVCESDHSCCTQEPLATTCSGDPGDDCNTSVPNNCGVTVSCPMTCDSGFTCDANAAAPHKCACTPDAKRCVMGMTQQTCNSTGLAWGNDMSCPTACLDGIGCASCIPTHTQCSDQTHVQTCGNNGTFGAAVACPAGTPFCIPASGACTGVCNPGDVECRNDPDGQGQAVVHCDTNGQWTIVNPGDHCSNLGCTTDHTACAECDPSNYDDPCRETKCNSNGIIVPDIGCSVNFCCCFNEVTNDRSCMRTTACHSDDGTVFCS